MKLIEELKQVFDTYTAGTLSFRAFARADAYPLFEAAKNETFSEKLWWGPPESIEEVVEEVDKLLAEHADNKSLVLSVCERDNGKWVGLIKFSELNGSLAMSLWTHPDYWRTMSPFRCAESAIDIVLKHSTLSHIFARITRNYPTMEKMVLTNGFVFYSETQVTHSRGHLVDCNLFKLERDSWTRSPKIKTF